MFLRLVRLLVTATVAAIAVLGAGQGVAAASSWRVQTAPPAQAYYTALSGVSCPSTSYCIAVGSSIVRGGPGETTFAERWDGTGWTIQTTPNESGASDSRLQRVSCTSPTACVAVGFSWDGNYLRRRPLAERWDGTSWTLLNPSIPAGAQSSPLEDVSCTSANDCVAVGSYMISESAPPVAFTERWNGSSWTLQTVASPPDDAELHGVSCTSPTACTAVGSLGNYTGTPSVLAERWNGTAWTQQTALNPTGQTWAELLGASCASATACTAVGFYEHGFFEGSPLAERWDGTTWTVQKTPSDATGGWLYSASCPSATVCTAVGDGMVERWKAVAGWTLQSVPWPSGAEQVTFMSVSCPKVNTCTAVGNYYSGATGRVPLVERYS